MALNGGAGAVPCAISKLVARAAWVEEVTEIGIKFHRRERVPVFTSLADQQIVKRERARSGAAEDRQILGGGVCERCLRKIVINVREVIYCLSLA